MRGVRFDKLSADSFLSVAIIASGFAGGRSRISYPLRTHSSARIDSYTGNEACRTGEYNIMKNIKLYAPME